MVDVSNYIARKTAGLVTLGKVGNTGVITIKTFDPQLGTPILTANVIQLADVNSLIAQVQANLTDLNQLHTDLQAASILV